MSARKNTTNRLTLIRECGVCGKSFSTTADTPWLRQMVVDGRQINTYFCSRSCHSASYKHKFDGKAEGRRKQREAERASEKNRLYYQRHIEQERARARRRYWADPERARADQEYQRRKRKLLEDNV